MTDTNTDGQRRVRRWVVASAIAGTVLIGIGAFWLSFTALADLARRAGTPAELAWVWPLIVDGVIVIATISVVALSGYGRRATRYPWTLLAGAAIVSVSANVTHAVVAADEDVPALLASVVASVPPVVLLAITHLTVELGRYQHPTRPAPSPALRCAKDAERRLETKTAPATQAPAPSITEPPAAGPGAVTHLSVAARRGATASLDGEEDMSTSGEDRVREAVVLRAEGLSNRRIAERLGVHPSTVGRWLNGTAPGSDSDRRAGHDEITKERLEDL